jgi:hypothetical protein
MAGIKYHVTKEVANNHNQMVGLSGPWGILSRVTNVLCSDGKRRTAFVHTLEPNGYDSIDARVNIGRTSKLGRLYVDSNGEYRLTIYARN